MTGNGYKKYMKPGAKSNDYSLIKLFAISFFGMLLIFTILIKSFSPSVDVSIGDYKQENDVEEMSVNIDDRLSSIQDEDRGRSFEDLMKNASDVQPETVDNQTKPVNTAPAVQKREIQETVDVPVNKETIYKVYIGTYTSAEQAKVAKDIIQESSMNLSPIIKCIGSNNYTLQVGTFRNKNGAEALLASIKQNHMPGRIVQED